MTYPLRSQYHAFRKSLSGAIDSLWPRADFDDILEPIIENRLSKPVLPVPSGMSEEAQIWLKDWNSQQDMEALLQTRRPCTVDPKLGLLFADGKAVWNSSDKPDRERNPRYLGHLGRANRRLGSAILLHHLHGDNYFHFVVRVLSKLSMLDSAGIDKDVPFLINEICTRAPVFQDALRMGLFGDRELIVQPPREIIQVDRAYLPRPAVYQKKTLQWVADRLRGDIQPTNDQPIFAVRTGNAANGRTFRNQDEVSALATRLGYRVQDPALLSFREQISLFSGAPVIAGAHGAALTNIIYRAGTRTSILELFSPSMGGPHYYLLSKALGFSYESVLTKQPVGRGFKASTVVDIDQLKQSLTSATANNHK